MAIAAVFNIPGMTQEQYDKTIELLEAKNLATPEGRLYHVGCPTDNGWFVLDVWESEEKMGKFADSLIPTLVEAGITPAEPTLYPAYNIISG